MQEAARLNELMGQERSEIERLKAETTLIRDETRTLLVSIRAKRCWFLCPRRWTIAL